MGDAQYASMSKNFKMTLVYFSPALITVVSYLAMVTLPSYKSQKAILLLLVNYILSNVALGMMLSGMTGKKTHFFPRILLLLFVPLFAYHVLGVSAETEMVLSIGVTVYSFILFYARVTLISIQWCHFAGTPFFIVPKEKR